MLIGIDASRANQAQKTGVEWYSYHLIQNLKKIIPENINVVLYTREFLQGELANMPHNWCIKVLNWPPKRFWTQIRLSFEMLLSPPDILFIPAHVFPFIHPKKTVMTIHDIASVKFPESYNWFERWYSKWSAKKALNNLWKIIVPTEFVKQELFKYFGSLNQNKVKVIYHGIDENYNNLEISKEKKETILKKYCIKENFIMTVGRLEEKKNTRRLVEAFNIVKQKLPENDLQLLLLGKHGYGYEKVSEAINSSNYKDSIIETGWVDEADLPYLFKLAKVFVFPSLYEGFGLPILESLSSYTPVVAGKGSCLEEIGSEACKYVDPFNTNEIALGIIESLENNSLTEEKKEKGLQRAKDFSWEKCALETLEFLSS